MKRVFNFIARFFVTLYANILYKKAVSTANSRYSQEKQMIYVIERIDKPGYLTLYDKKRFKRHKRIFGTPARLLTLETMKQRSYYHTPDKAGNQALTENDKEIRRLAFIRERLLLAKLI